ncbi:MAG: formylmethanofuran dehydrogenase [Desulfuromonas sp.]|nr:MAG: formylmethanofuran dehydrogenase [Desulfuromonas sp.]
MTYEQIVSFHGHSCPGLAIGYRMSRAALEALQSLRAEDEELVAITENDACGVDALQCLTGCTFGKGNLLFRDYGKQAYILYSRASRSGVRVVYHGNGVPRELRSDRPARIKKILSAEECDLVSVTRVTIPEPEPARIMESQPCASCGERVMSSRLQERAGKLLCIPCREQH